MDLMYIWFVPADELSPVELSPVVPQPLLLHWNLFLGVWGPYQERKVLKCLFSGQGKVNFQEEMGSVIVIIVGWGLKELSIFCAVDISIFGKWSLRIWAIAHKQWPSGLLLLMWWLILFPLEYEGQSGLFTSLSGQHQKHQEKIWTGTCWKTLKTLVCLLLLPSGVESTAFRAVWTFGMAANSTAESLCSLVKPGVINSFPFLLHSNVFS